MRPRLAFLCRGSAEHGLGHVMRSRAVAEAALDHADSRLFVIGDENVAPIVDDRPTPADCFADQDTAASAVAAWGADAVFFDTTELSPGAFDRAGARALRVSLSPVFDRLAACDLFFHRTREHPLAGGPGRMMGLEYTVVRDVCRPIPERVYADALAPGAPLAVAVCMGGGDATNKTLRVLERLRELRCPLLLWVLLGEAYPHSHDELVACARADRRHEVILARTTDSMWRVMRSCAVAVLAGGTVTYEAAAAGLPSVNLFDDLGQTYLVNELVTRGAAFDASAPFEDASERAARLIASFDANRDLLLAARRACHGLIDGHGATRIVLRTLETLGARQDAA